MVGGGALVPDECASDEDDNEEGAGSRSLEVAA